MIDVIIPTYKPDRSLIELIGRLKKQTIKPDHIIIVNTEKSYFDECFSGSDVQLNDGYLKVHHINKCDFDHGNTRNLGVSLSDADVFVMMTQDAMPANEHFIENLVGPLKEETVGCSYARQLAKEESTVIEKITREFNYPDTSLIKSEDDVKKLGIKAFFCSNVSCAYKRKVFDQLGGFVKRTIFNEDMIYASGMVKAGYKIAYSADAEVYHSHNYSAMEQFHRNVDLGISQADHPEVFAGISSESEGTKMVKLTIRKLCESGNVIKILPYIYMTGWKYMGYLVGKNYKKLPLWFVKKCSMSPGYFEE